MLVQQIQLDQFEKQINGVSFQKESETTCQARKGRLRLRSSNAIPATVKGRTESR